MECDGVEKAEDDMDPSGSPASDVQPITSFAEHRSSIFLVTSELTAISASSLNSITLPSQIFLNTFAMLMLCCVIFTDVFSTIPFLVKVVELIKTGTGTRRAMGAYLLRNMTFGQMGIFRAEFSGKESYTVVGIVFVAVACVVMIFGAWLEVRYGIYVQCAVRNGKQQTA